jgi:hypothetical protein
MNDGKADARAELRTWYVERFRPKLARAVSEGSLRHTEASALDTMMQRMLGFRQPEPARARRNA